MRQISTSRMGTAWRAYEQDIRTEFELPNSEPVTLTASTEDMLIVRKMPVASGRLAMRMQYVVWKETAWKKVMLLRKALAAHEAIETTFR
ncbi:MAG: hypothetical protein HY913_17150 [Desulfomonile tiedjei]|nr:hypothetical protein [Desulfomonile tiedjei]